MVLRELKSGVTAKNKLFAFILNSHINHKIMASLDIETIREVKRLIDKKITNISDQIIYGSIDNYEKLQYSRGQISSLNQLKEDLSEQLRDDNDKD